MTAFCKLPPTLTPQPEGGYVVTSPLLPELVTEGDSLDDVLANVRDALEAVLEIYRDLGRELPAGLRQDAGTEALRFDFVVAVA